MEAKHVKAAGFSTEWQIMTEKTEFRESGFREECAWESIDPVRSAGPEEGVLSDH